jgi:hypothetical protein
MSEHDPEPDNVPPGHGEPLQPAAQRRCPQCGSLVQNIRPGVDAWLGWCPDHGTVRLP